MFGGGGGHAFGQGGIDPEIRKYNNRSQWSNNLLTILQSCKCLEAAWEAWVVAAVEVASTSTLVVVHLVAWEEWAACQACPEEVDEAKDPQAASPFERREDRKSTFDIFQSHGVAIRANKNSNPCFSFRVYTCSATTFPIFRTWRALGTWEKARAKAKQHIHRPFHLERYCIGI